MKILLDTNAYSDLARGLSPLTDWVRRAETVLFSSVVAGELLGGFRRGSRLSENVADLQRFVAQPRVHLLPVTWTTAERYGRIYAALRRRGKPIPANDIWIAAHAMETGAELLSSDTHFQYIEGLVWTDPGSR
ncbi:MAG TPA: type II toxin-antitoxin system VapC family toxin [Thermoanaerobaculia bacterium]